MINERDLQLIINKYNLHLTREKKVLILNNSTLEEVDKILNYLINELKIDARNIEKCPSILYKDYETIRLHQSNPNRRSSDKQEIPRSIET